MIVHSLYLIYNPLSRLQDKVMKKPDTPPRPTNRDKITRAAIHCFVETGIAQSSVRDIAEQAGVSQGNMYNHFRSKDALIAEIARLDGAEMQTVLDAAEGLDPVPALWAMCRAYLALAARPADAVLTLEIAVQALRNPEVAQAFDTGRARVRQAMETLVQRAQADGTCPTGLPARDLVAALLETIDGLGLRLGLENRTARPAETAILNRMLAALLGDE